MTETQEQTSPAAVEASKTDVPAANGAAATRASRSKGGSLSSKLLPELQQIAGGLGISTAKMKKSDLIAAIQAAQSGANGGSRSAAAKRSEAPAGESPAGEPQAAEAALERPARRERPARNRAESGEHAATEQTERNSGQPEQRERTQGGNQQEAEGVID